MHNRYYNILCYLSEDDQNSVVDAMESYTGTDRCVDCAKIKDISFKYWKLMNAVNGKISNANSMNIRNGVGCITKLSKSLKAADQSLSKIQSKIFLILLE